MNVYPLVRLLDRLTVMQRRALREQNVITAWEHARTVQEARRASALKCNKSVPARLLCVDHRVYQVKLVARHGVQKQRRDGLGNLRLRPNVGCDDESLLLL